MTIGARNVRFRCGLPPLGSELFVGSAGTTMNDVLANLAATIRARRSAPADASYTRQLLDAGAERCARKFGEEAIETVLAGVSQSNDDLTAEAADVIYHLLVLLECRDIVFADVLAKLEERTAKSGVAEKAARSKS